MKCALLSALLARKATIKEQWRSTLQSCPAHSPLAHPDLLGYLIDETIDELTLALWQERPETTSSANSGLGTGSAFSISCAYNPYVGYFLAGESALVSAIRTIAPTAELSENEILAEEIELLSAFRALSRREVVSFCRICQIEHPASMGKGHSVLPKSCPFKHAMLFKPKELVCPD